MKLKFPITAKLSILVVVMVAATAFAINEVYVRGSNQVLVDLTIKDMEKEVGAFTYPLGNFIDRLTDDARLISQVQSTQGFMRANLNRGIDPEDGSTRAQLESRVLTVFKEMMVTRDPYRQIRFIAAEGQGREILKVERFGNRIDRAPEDKLQEQEGESYLEEAFRLQPGEVYLSAPGLAKEKGVVSLPHSLILRAAVPVYKPDKEIFGLVVIDMDFESVFKNISKNLLENRTLYITDAKGDYLVHPDPSKLFASDLGHDRRIQKEASRIAEVMANTKTDRVTFLPEDKARGNVFTFQKFHYNPLHPNAYLGIALEAPYRDIIKGTEKIARDGFIFSLCVSLAAALTAIVLLRFSIRPLNRIAEAVVRYRRGEKDIHLPTDSPDEIGVLAREFQAMMKQKGEEDWVKENLVAISRSILGFKNLQDFGDALMEALTPAAGAQVGVLYISSAFGRDIRSRDHETLTILGACGYTERASLPAAFRWGEGLVGQCAKDRTSRLVSDIPEDYLSIASALGESRPTHMLLLPVLFENTLAGVLELASLNGFSEVQLSFLEQLSFNIGVIISSISASVRTEELLEEARQTAEELQRSEEELKTQQEELEASNEEMEERTRELEELNKQIKESGDRLSAVVGSALDGIMSIDERGIVQTFNPACERLFGYSAQEVVDQNIKMLMPDSYHSEQEDYLSRYVTSGEGREVKGNRRDGSIFPMELSVSAFAFGNRRYFSVTIRDITQRKEAENKLLRYQEDLELSSRYKSEFLANMSHELRTPLNSLLILARSLAGNEEGNLTEDQIEEAKIIHNGGLELLGLINDILDLSKVEAGKMSLVTEEISINGIVKRLEQQFDPIAREAGVAFHLRLAENLPETLHTDSQRVEQILKNLLSNAFKFTSEGSVTLEVSQPGKEISLQRETLEHGATIAFSVTDSGIGIEESKLNDIFEAFQQEDGSTDRHYGGTGLGLTIARKFAHMLGGEIHVVSKKGKGSTFTLILPAARARESI
ncbi:MAG: PAS domain S-box protein [Alphaproteobacteria bacterium]|nr:PAS domain S-box protein [Alphaproteobacteria bacterium]